MATKLQQYHLNVGYLLIPEGMAPDKVGTRFHDLLQGELQTLKRLNVDAAQGWKLFIQGWNEQISGRVPDLIAEQKAPDRTPEMNLAITANYAAYSAGYDAAVTILTEIWEANKAAKRIDVVIENVDGARGAFNVSAGGVSQIVWDRASSAIEESVRFTTVEAGKENENLEINGQSWRALEEDHESTGGATTFYKNVLTGTTLARAIKQACVFHDHHDFDITSTSSALRVAQEAIDSALFLSNHGHLLPSEDARTSANARISRNDGATSYFGGVKRALKEAEETQAKESVTLASISEFLRGEGFEISHNDHQIDDVEAAVRYIVQRLDETEQQQDAAFASNKQTG
jgi:hypothetical protein